MVCAIVLNTDGTVVISCEDDFSSDCIVAVEQLGVAVVDSAAGVDGVSAGEHELFRCLYSLIQEEVSIVLQSADIVIFAECSLKQASPRFECKRSPFGDFVKFVGCREIFRSIVQVLNDFDHYKVAGVPWLVEIRVCRTELLVIPRNITETLHFLEIEVCPEEPCKSHILIPDLNVRAVYGVLYQSVVVPERSECPASSGSRYGAAVPHFGKKTVLNQEI